ncbi:MAG: zinc-dependent metalloprotease, partial [Myxococcota bacterium]|nr:zinc-dependent metalloprotease [Myxococcota bacterium]
MRNRWRLIRATLGALVALVSIASCAQDVGLIDRSQPGLLKKSVFDGEWFMRRTVIDAPYDTGFTFIGEQDEVSRVRWELQENHLIAWRVLPQVDDTPDAAPMAVFAIEGHVDLMRDYSASTGEQTNVLNENTSDRVWYERSYVRVDWSQNLVTNFHFWVEGLEQDPVAYFIEDTADSDSLLIGVKDGDTWTDHQDMVTMREVDDAQYLDVVTKVFVKPEEIGWEDWYGDVYYEPACWWYGNYDCAPGVISVRSSFLRVDAAVGDYDPIRVRWNGDGDRERVTDGEATGGGADEEDKEDAQGQPSDIAADPYATQDTSVVRLPYFDKFGYFRTERYGYDPLYGEVQSERSYFINRWNLWEQSHDELGQPLPYAERTPKPIVYYLAPDHPEWMLGVAQQVADQWDAAFRETVSALTGQEAPRMFELRMNSREVDPETGEVLVRGEVNGDLRYSHLWWVSQPTRVGLLGYGPSAADPTTGQVFAADAYVYGASVIEYATGGRDIVELLNGRLEPEEFALGENIKQYLHGLKAGGSQSARRSIDELREFAHSHTGAGPPEHDHGAVPKRSERPPSPSKQAAGKPGIERFKRPAGWASAQLARVQDTHLEDMLMSDPAILAMKGAGRVGPDTPLMSMPPAMQSRVSPIWWSASEYKRQTLERMRRFSKRNMMMGAFFDDAIAGLALSLKDEDPDAIHQLIAQQVFRSTAEHEVGHTIGLRHNFEASTDALNYHPEYWSLRGANPVPLAELTQPEIDGRIREYQYSSIMDYASRFNMDTAGLGRYDIAAIKFGYGQLIEVFDQAPNEPMLMLQSYEDGTHDRPFTLDAVLRDF